MQFQPADRQNAQYLPMSEDETIWLARLACPRQRGNSILPPSPSIYLWIKRSNAGKLKPGGPSKLTAEQRRIRELERELAIARMERDLLKKTAAYFAKESR